MSNISGGWCMKPLGLLLAAYVLASSSANAEILITNDEGGSLAQYFARYQGIRDSGDTVVIDGACRDIDEIRVTKLWLASRWVVPTTGKRRLKLQPLGGTVSVGGIQVSQGDLVAGDDTGIVVVPRERLLEVLEQAERIVAIDERVEERIRAGESFGSAAAAAGYLPAQQGRTP